MFVFSAAEKQETFVKVKLRNLREIETRSAGDDERALIVYRNDIYFEIIFITPEILIRKIFRLLTVSEEQTQFITKITSEIKRACSVFCANSVTFRKFHFIYRNEKFSIFRMELNEVSVETETFVTIFTKIKGNHVG